MYFITICTHNFVEWFGTINDRKLGLNAMGDIAEKCWIEIPNHFENEELDEFIVMPNHIPGIICIVETRHAVSLQENKNKFGPLKKGSLSTIVGSYKSAVTRTIHKNENPDFKWQPRFYDHVVRNEIALENIQYYIIQNPAN